MVALPSVTEPDAESRAHPRGRAAHPAVRGRHLLAPAASSRWRPAPPARSCSRRRTQAFDQEIVAGTRVHTPAGVEFQTTEAVTLPRSASDGGPARGPRAGGGTDASGEDGNVAAGSHQRGALAREPGHQRDQPRGHPRRPLRRRPRWSRRQDYDAAAVDLQNRLAGALAAYLRDPANMPEGLTLFAETARPGAGRCIEPLRGRRHRHRALRSSRSAARSWRSVLAVDTRLVDAVLHGTAARARVPEGCRILAESVRVGARGGQRGRSTDPLRAAVAAAARSIRSSTPTALLDQVAGLPVSDARAILEAIGTSDRERLARLPGELPDDRQRITLDVLEPSTTE